MTSQDLIRWALKMTDEWMVGAVKDLSETPLLQPTVRGGNHAHWTIGHVAVVEGSFRRMLFGEPNPLEAWQPLFGMGTTPSAEGAGYPPYGEVLAAYRELRAANLASLDALGEAGLDEPPAKPSPKLSDLASTRGQVLLFLVMHQLGHLGQLSVVRRAAGKPWRF